MSEVAREAKVSAETMKPVEIERRPEIEKPGDVLAGDQDKLQDVLLDELLDERLGSRQPAAKPNLDGLAPLPEFLSFSPPLMGEEEKEAVVEALLSGWLTTGPRAEKFERAMAEHLGADGALAVSSCTAALHLAMRVLDIGPGQAVITTPLTFVSTAQAAIYEGARPFLADVSPDTGNLDPDKIEEFIELKCRPGSDGRPVHKDTDLVISALVPVHYGGHPADLAGIWKIALKHRLHVVEDAAHAIGSEYGGLPIGHQGLVPKDAIGSGLKNLGCFSFYATKNITTGEGGLLTSSDPALLERAKKLSAYGISDARRLWGRYAPQGSWAYDVAEPGFKYNFTDIQAAIGLVQISRLKEFISQRCQRAKIWLEALAPLSNLAQTPSTRAGSKTSWHIFPLRIRPENLAISRDDIISSLRRLNIGTSVMFIPIHYHSFYRAKLGYEAGDFPIAEDFFLREISLPLSPASKLPSIKDAANILHELLIRHAKEYRL